MSGYNYKQVQQKNFRSDYDEYYEKMKMAKVGVIVATEYVYYESEGIQNIFLSLIQQILDSNYSNDVRKKIEILQTLNGIINSNIISTRYRDGNPNDFKQIIRKQMQDFFFEDDREENVDYLASQIARNPIQAILTFLETYIDAFEEIEKINEVKSRNSRRIVDDYDRKPVVPIRLTQQNVKEKINGGLFNATGPIDESISKYVTDYYKLLEKNSSNDFDFYYPSMFYGQRNVNDIFNFYSLSRSENTNTVYGMVMRYYNLVRLGELATSIAYADLVSGYDYYAESTEFAKFIEQFKPRRVLDIYDKMQNEYIKMYDALSDDIKDAIDRKIKTRSWAKNLGNYRKTYGIDLKSNETLGSKVATVNQIKAVINNRVVKKYLSKGEREYPFCETPLLHFIPEYRLVGDGFIRNSIGYSLKHMSAQEIANLYLKLRNSYNHKDKLQLLFAKLIRDRMIGSREVDKLAIGEDNNKEYLTQIEMDLVAICNDFFNEKPAFETKFIKPNDVELGYARRKITSSEEIQKAERRYYNMSKLSQAFNTEIVRLRELMETRSAEQFSPEELAEIHRMFKR